MRLLLLLLVLSGCASSEAIRQDATDKTRAAKDSEARVLIDSTCLIGIGAWIRLKSEDEQRGVLMLCGAAANVPGEKLEESQ